MARRRLIGFAIAGIAFYAVAMVATLPASVVFKNRPWRTGVAGTVWNGEVGVRGGVTMRWSWSPLRSLTSLGFAADWKATGPDTDLGGRLVARPGGTAFDTVSGSAGAVLLEAIGRNLPFTCELTAQVEIARAAIGGSGQMMRGRIASDAGTCRPRGAGAPTALPPLLLIAETFGTETRIRVVPATQRRRVLISAVLQADGAIDATLTPEGADMLPFLGLPAGARIQQRL